MPSASRCRQCCSSRTEAVLNNAAAEIQQPGAAQRNAVCRGVCKKKRTKTSGTAGFLRHNKPSGFPQRLTDGLRGERQQPVELDDLGADAVGGKRLRCGERCVDADAVGDDRYIAAAAQNGRILAGVVVK